MAKNAFDQFDSAPGGQGNPFDQFEGGARPQSSLARRVVGDTAISALKGAISVPETAVGLADIISGGQAGKQLEGLGFRPKEAKEALNTLYSPEQQAANQAVSDADGFLDTVKAAVTNPSTIAQTIVESAPSMLAGGYGARVLSGATKMAPVIAGGVGEGLVAAGQAAEGIRQSTEDGTLSGKQALSSLASGAGTAAIGVGGGKIAQKLGLADIDTMMAGGVAAASKKGVARRIIEGGISEGVFEELPQSVQEQIWSNVAQDKPLMEGVDNAAAMGMLAGMGMGGPSAAIFHGNKSVPSEAEPPTPLDEQKQADSPLGLPNRGEETMVVFPDGSAGTQAQFDAYIEALPESERVAARAKMLNLGTQPGDIPEPGPEPEKLGLPNYAYSTMAVFPDGSTGTQQQLDDYMESLPVEQRVAARAKLFNLSAAANPKPEEAEAGAETLALPNYAHATMVSFPDGSLGTKEQADSFIASLPENERSAAIAKMIYGVDPVVHEVSTRAAEWDAEIAERKKAAGLDKNFAGKKPTQVKAETTTTPAPASTGDTAVASSNVDVSANDAATSDLNDLTPPTDAQKEAGNYKVGRARVAGLNISIENPQDSVRRSKAGAKNAWETTMQHHYGYIKGVPARAPDKEHVDVYVKPGTAENFAGNVYVVNQNHPDTGKFDEPKVMLGFDSVQEAQAAYMANYTKDWNGFGSIAEVSMPRFKIMLQGKNSFMKPVQGTASPTQIATVTPTPAQLQQAAPEPSSEEQAESPVRSMVEALVKRRAAAQQMNREKSFDNALKDAKDLLAGNDVKPSKFKAYASTFKNDKELFNILNELHQEADNSPSALAAREKKSQLARQRAAEARKINTKTDDLMAAMAKLGGVNIDKAQSEYGLESQGMKQQGSGILRSFTKTGMDPDYMRGLLADLGYPVGDDLASFGDAIDDAMNGISVMTFEGQQAIAEKEQEDYDARYDELNDYEQDALDAAVSQASKLFGDEKIAAIDAKLSESMAGQPVAVIERRLTEILNEAIRQVSAIATGNEDGTRAGTDSSTESDSQDADGTQEQAAGDVVEEAIDQPQPEDKTDLLGQDTSRAQAVADATREKDAKRNAGESNSAEFTLTGSNSEADKAAAHGAQDLFNNDTDTVPEKIADLGEKIGGARKDTATSKGPKAPAPAKPENIPSWQKRYVAVQNTDEVNSLWRVIDNNKKRFVTSTRYASQAEAEATIPLIAVSEKHFVTSNGDKFEIWRRITDRKRVKVVNQQFDSREAAMEFMAKNPVAILAVKTSYGEEILAKPENVLRSGEEYRQGDVQGSDFMSTFGFRGVEFGNWNNQVERQEIMNHAFDGLMDLATILKVPPKALSLNGDLALAFGARGQGLSGARAHYERDYGVMNLTKMQGAGALAHEWFHALDHYIGRQDGKASSEKVKNSRGDSVFAAKNRDDDYASYGFKRAGSGVREEVRNAFSTLIEGMYRKAEKYVEDTENAEKWISTTRDALAGELQKFRNELARELDPKYFKRNGKPASPELLAEVDGYIDRIMAGEFMDLERRANESSQRKRWPTYRNSNDALDRLGAIYKQVRGRSAFNSDHKGYLDSLGGYISRFNTRLGMLADARKGSEKEKQVLTTFAMNAKSIDQGRASDYWTTNTEMGARAFSSFIEDKVKEMGNSSDFLSFGSDNWRYSFYNVKPFPEGEERKSINGLFEKLFDTLETKETDKGVALFSKDRSSAPVEDDMAALGAMSRQIEELTKPIHMEDLQAVGTIMRDRFPGIPSINVLARVKDAPKDLAKQIGQDRAAGAWYEGHVFLFAENIRDTEHAVFVAMHEATHNGLRGLLGNALDPVMLNIQISNKKVRDMARKLKQGDSSLSTVRSVEEVLADMGGDQVPASVIDRLVAVVRNMIRKVGVKLNYSDAEVRVLVNNALTFSKKPMRGAHIMNGIALSQDRTAGQATDTWEVPETGKIDSLIYALQDKNIDLKRVTQNIKKTAGELADEVDAYLQEELYHGRTAKRTKTFIEEELDPLIADMRARGVKMVDFEEYLWARHAEERNEQIAKINTEMPDGGSGMKTQEARDYLAGLDDRRKRSYEALAKRVDSINAKSRQILVDYGLESADTVQAWQKSYSNYVPLMREDMEMGFGNGTGQGYSVKGNSAKRATGSKRAVVDILANIAQQREKNIIRGEKNRVSTALIGLAKQNPNKEFWKIDSPPTIRTVNDSTGLVEERQDPMYKTRDNVIIARVPNVKGEIEEKSVLLNERDERAMRMARSLKNLDQDQIGELLGTASAITRYFSSINTQYNPIFGVINIARDVQGALLNLSTTGLAGKEKDVIANTVPALKAIYSEMRKQRKGQSTNSSWSTLWNELQNEGGTTGYRDMFRNAQDRAEAIQKSLDPDWWKSTKWGKTISANGALAGAQQWIVSKPGKAIFDWLSDYNETLENSVRLAAYKVALDNGMTKARAASLAKNLTVNFNRKGEMGRQIGSLYAFFNASVQGTARIAETLAGPLGQKIVVGGLLMGVMQALAMSAAGFGDDEPPDFVRDRNFIIPTGDGKFISIPMPLGYNVIPGFGRVVTEWAMAGFKEPEKRFVHLLDMLFDTTNPIGNAGLSMQTLAPTVLDPVAALAENKDFSGRPIARKDFNTLDPTPGFTRAKDTASALSKNLAWGINALTGGTDYKPGAISPTPDQIDYLIGQVTGGVGREYLKAEQTVTSAVTGEDLPMHKIPLLGRFAGDTTGQSSQSAAFYSNIEELNKHENEIKGRLQDKLDVAQYRLDNPESQLIGQSKIALGTVKKLRKRRAALLDSQASAEDIKAIDERITAVMTNLNNRVQSLSER